MAKIKEAKLEWEKNDASEGHELTSMYIMTNADKRWQDALKAKLFAEGWLTVVSINDLILDAEQTTVAVAIDMDIGRRAAVFIGNGVSYVLTSLSRNATFKLTTSSIT